MYHSTSSPPESADIRGRAADDTANPFGRWGATSEDDEDARDYAVVVLRQLGYAYGRRNGHELPAEAQRLRHDT